MAALHAPIRLYLITDRTQTNGRALIDVVTAAVRGGVDAVQLREKDMNARDLLQLARTLLPICHARGTRLLINDRIDVMLASGADGVHLPAASFVCGDARRLVGERIIGVSTHSIGEVDAAARGGADFAVFGPVYATPSKAEFGQPLGEAVLAAATRRAALPVLALGGIGVPEVARVLRCGAVGVGVMRAILSAIDPYDAAKCLRMMLT